MKRRVIEIAVLVLLMLVLVVCGFMLFKQNITAEINTTKNKEISSAEYQQLAYLVRANPDFLAQVKALFADGKITEEEYKSLNYNSLLQAKTKTALSVQLIRIEKGDTISHTPQSKPSWRDWLPKMGATPEDTGK
jgi:hypothetical protein